MNDADIIRAAFADYYRTTIPSDETDPNKLHDLKADLDGSQVYAQGQVEQLVALYLGGTDRDQLDPILDACVATYVDSLDEDGQVNFKGKAKAFARTYGFLASILPYTNADWEKLSIFLNFLIPKLPVPKEEDLSKGILEAIDIDSYRAEVPATMTIALADQDVEINPIPTSGSGHMLEPALDRLSNILKVFNDLFANIDRSPNGADGDAGSILITSEVLRLAEGHIQVNALGPIPIKGLHAPVEIFRRLDRRGLGAHPPRYIIPYLGLRCRFNSPQVWRAP
jgi:type I restriction enzyme R subunit